MKVKIEHHFFPWRRAQKLVQSGTIDALITNYTSERQTYTNASNEYVTNAKRMIFIQENNPLIPKLLKLNSLDQLVSYSMGSYIGNHWAENNLEEFNIQWAGNVNAALKMLSAKRFDIYLGNSISTMYKLKVLNIDNIIMLPVLLSDVKSSEFRLLINKKSTYVDLIPSFDLAIKSMKDDGTLEQIFKKYKTKKKDTLVTNNTPTPN